MAWEYQRNENTGFKTNIPEGRYRVRIKSAEKTQSKSGNDMLALQFDVNGYSETLYHYIVFMPDKAELTNQKLTQFFDSFKGIPDGEFDTAKWIGQTGACTIKHDKYEGNTKSKVGYFIPADKQQDLPLWTLENGVQETADGFIDIPEGMDGDLPF